MHRQDDGGPRSPRAIEGGVESTANGARSVATPPWESVRRTRSAARVVSRGGTSKENVSVGPRGPAIGANAPPPANSTSIRRFAGGSSGSVAVHDRTHVDPPETVPVGAVANVPEGPA